MADTHQWLSDLEDELVPFVQLATVCFFMVIPSGLGLSKQIGTAVSLGVTNALATSSGLRFMTLSLIIHMPPDASIGTTAITSTSLHPGTLKVSLITTLTWAIWEAPAGQIRLNGTNVRKSDLTYTSINNTAVSPSEILAQNGGSRQQKKIGAQIKSAD